MKALGVDAGAQGELALHPRHTAPSVNPPFASRGLVATFSLRLIGPTRPISGQRHGHYWLEFSQRRAASVV
jgi:hypothetical protein